MDQRWNSFLSAARRCVAVALRSAICNYVNHGLEVPSTLRKRNLLAGAKTRGRSERRDRRRVGSHVVDRRIATTGAAGQKIAVRPL